MTITDSRLDRAAILAGDALELVRELEDEIPDSDVHTRIDLARARQCLKVSQQALRSARTKDEPVQCGSHMATGGQCDLSAGHDGKHTKTYPNGTAEWTDDGQKNLIERFGGTHGT